MIYQIACTQQLNCDIQTAWDFFSSPHNLAEISPKDMNIVIVNDIRDKPIYEGMVIDYNVSPLFGVRMNWQTKIRKVRHHVSFTDEQVKGPFKLWRHAHEFIPNEHGVLMCDVVSYKLPFGFVGRLVDIMIVENKIMEIFKYRYRVIEEIFNSKTNRNECSNLNIWE